jgi:hypothetical protein
MTLHPQPAAMTPHPGDDRRAPSTARAPENRPATWAFASSSTIHTPYYYD